MDVVQLRLADLNLEKLPSSLTLDELAFDFETSSHLARNNVFIVRHSAIHDNLQVRSTASIVYYDEEEVFSLFSGGASPSTHLNYMVHELLRILMNFSNPDTRTVRECLYWLLFNWSVTLHSEINQTFISRIHRSSRGGHLSRCVYYRRCLSSAFALLFFLGLDLLRLSVPVLVAELITDLFPILISHLSIVVF